VCFRGHYQLLQDEYQPLARVPSPRPVTLQGAGLKISAAWGKVRTLLPVLARFTPERPCAPLALSPAGDLAGR
jgi:hypothetical protein